MRLCCDLKKLFRMVGSPPSVKFFGAIEGWLKRKLCEYNTFNNLSSKTSKVFILWVIDNAMTKFTFLTKKRHGHNLANPKLVWYQIGLIEKYFHVFFGGPKSDRKKLWSEENFQNLFWFNLLFASSRKFSYEPFMPMSSINEMSHCGSEVVAFGEYYEISRKSFSIWSIFFNWDYLSKSSTFDTPNLNVLINIIRFFYIQGRFKHDI